MLAVQQVCAQASAFVSPGLLDRPLRDMYGTKQAFELDMMASYSRKQCILPAGCAEV